MKKNGRKEEKKRRKEKTTIYASNTEKGEREGERE